MDDLDSPAALADDAPPVVSPPEPHTVQGACANCGEALRGSYCAACGQPDLPLREPVHHFLGRSLVELFGLDGRVWATFGVLLFKPGKLTRAYLDGRRQHYLRPLRVYITSTLAFFVLLALLDPVGRVGESLFDEGGVNLDSTVVVAAHLADVERQIADEPGRIARAEREADSLRTQLDSLVRAAVPGGVALDDVPTDSLQPTIARRVADSTYADTFDDLVDSVSDAADDLDDARADERQRTSGLELEAAMLRVLPPDSTVRLADIKAARAQIYPEANANIGLPDWMVRSESVRRLDKARTGEESAEAGMAFFREAIGRVPTVLFLILPVFALLLKLLYVRRGWYYSEHLVFGLHTHAFAFVVFSVVTLLAALGSVEGLSTGTGAVGVLALILVWSIPLYFVVAQKHVYGQGWIKTVLKSLVLGTAYLFVLISGLVGAFLLAAALG